VGLTDGEDAVPEVDADGVVLDPDDQPITLDD
jgi:hypothetical protein